MKNLPEGKSLASIIVIAVQIGNIFPLIFSLLPKRPPLRWSMVVVLCCGIVSLVFLSITWSQTYYIFGADRSLMLYIGTFIAAGADCLSNLVFWPYVGQFPKSYVTAMGTGESLSSAVAAIVSSSQKSIGFSPATFFMILTAIVFLCSASYAVLELKYASTLSEEAHSTKQSGYLDDLPSSDEIEEMDWKEHIGVFAVIASIAFVQNALNPSLLPFASRGNKNAYWVAQNALFIATPLASISASFFQPRKSIVAAICVWISTSIFIIVAASLSFPIVSDPTGSTALLVVVMVCSGTALAYSKVSAMLLLRSKSPKNAKYSNQYTQKLMTAAGISMQVGSVTGALLFFILVQVAKVFPS